MFGSGRDIKQQSRFTWIGLLSEVQPKFIISQRLSRVLKELALRQSRDATFTVVDFAFRDASAYQQGGYRDVAFAKNRNRLPSGEPGRAWEGCSPRFLGHAPRSEPESGPELTACWHRGRQLTAASSSTHLISYGLCRTTEDRLLNQHRAAGLQEISVRIESSPFRDCLPYRDLEVLNRIGSERINEGGIVGKVGLGYDYDIVVHELRLSPAPPLANGRPRGLFEAYVA